MPIKTLAEMNQVDQTKVQFVCYHFFVYAPSHQGLRHSNSVCSYRYLFGQLGENIDIVFLFLEHDLRCRLPVHLPLAVCNDSKLCGDDVRAFVFPPGLRQIFYGVLFPPRARFAVGQARILFVFLPVSFAVDNMKLVFFFFFRPALVLIM